ncbi:hypothetical protein Nepgr_003315 [Nepenthes gracilis]|uniref:DUF1365 domain-containing protein n=1 Tax=Nepenthes gracilis TaxID=150966 RepID=A0AAD3RZ96_NEPGR|nr:hypothetical protein Nepgr_003315 [Nepenthes gracilis]
MELFYLLCCVFSTSVVSFSLSFLLLIRILLHRHSPLAAASSSSSESVTLYEGIVWHERRRPIHHSFSYRVRYALIDLDRAPHAPPNHLSATEARRIAETTGPVFLLTIPASVGYQQNPLSVYYCYNLEDSSSHLKKCIAEVTNTPWGERVSFIFNPSSDLVAKALHVSPFMDMMGSWNIMATAPGDSLSVAILVQHPHLGHYFSATLKAKRIPSSVLSDHALFFWLMPHKVAVWIYWQALKLWWKNVSFIQHPRYGNPAYREEALLRDEKLKCGKHDNNEVGGSSRCFAWTDAKWPWS